MTIKELIEHLQTLDQTKRVIVNGYEGGFHDLKGVTLFPIKLNRNNLWWYGPHEETEVQYADEIAYLITRIPNPLATD